ncbi:MAG: hypothetical protein PHE55_03060 [Methylococcaceae bacterium]|nr:hypothetical protein [Methylococcaceae bacterium]
MKFFKPTGLALILTTGAAAAAPLQAPREGMNVVVDLAVVRPIALVGTAVGAALFAGLSPFTALASIAPPHDAFSRAADALIGMPACYAFFRPLGEPFGGQHSRARMPASTCR